MLTGFDIEKILRDNGAPKSFARAVAAACRAAGLFDRCHADDGHITEDTKDAIREIIKTMAG